MIAGRVADKYTAFLEKVRVKVAPITKLDAEEAARMKPTRSDLLDCLIASTVKRYGASIWTADKDFLKFLSQNEIRLLGRL